MQYRAFGNTGINVSEIGLGAMQLGRKLNEQDALALLDKAFDLGITLFDTSDDYGNSEVFIGKWLKSRKHRVTIQTKITCDPEWAMPVMGERIDLCLKRLQLDTVDIIELHNPHLEAIDRGDVFRALEKAKKAGKARFTGISHDAPHAEHCIRKWPFEVLQVDYSMMTRTPEKTLFPYTRANGIGVAGKMVLGRLIFERDEVPTLPWEKLMYDSSIEIDLPRWMDKHSSYTRPELLLRYALSNPGLHSALVGTIDPKHLEDNVRAAEKGPLPDDVLKDFKKWVDQKTK